MRWFDDKGALCISGNLHIPEEEAAMTSYTEEEIRKAFSLQGNSIHYSLGELLASLRKLKDTHVHDFTDDDTITVRELRESWERVRGPSPGTGLLLEDISKHREPEYPAGSVWRDRNEVTWMRVAGRKWKQFGNVMAWADNVPARPLKRMDVVT
jgi:hypothetical protein